VFTAARTVALGLVVSLARPGGNLTGVSFALPAATAKGLELLREILPQAERVAFLGSPLEINLPLREVEVNAAQTSG
jgi:putative ABC transport system substrate-binding protein